MKSVFAALTLFLLVAAPALARSGGEDNAPVRKLATENPEEDLNYFSTMTRRMGFRLGMSMPLGGLTTHFGFGNVIGVYYIWEAIKPFSFMMSFDRVGAPHRTSPGIGKFSDTRFGISTNARLGAWGRFLPYAGLGATLHFIDVAFPTTTTISSGNDATLSTLGFSLSLGGDFIVGREVGLGLELVGRYLVSKPIATSGGALDIGAPALDILVRIGF